MDVALRKSIQNSTTLEFEFELRHIPNVNMFFFRGSYL